MTKSNETLKPASIYFANLDALRFIAALIVLVFHLEHKKMLFGLSNIWNFASFSDLGGYGVTVFFVLSGFLISYLLMVEKAKTKTVSIRKFYLRRIFRIWPLYYLIIVLGLFVLPGIKIFEVPELSKLQEHLDVNAALLFFFFLSNVAFVCYGNVPFLDQTWSIGVEEQFYVFWPLLFKYLKVGALTLFLSIAFVFILLKFFFHKIQVFGYGDFFSIKTSSIFLFFKLTRFSCMGIGAIGAYCFFHKDKFKNQLSFFCSKNVQVTLYIVTTYFLIAGLQIIPFISSIFLFIAYYVLRNRKSRLFAYLGLLAFFLLVCMCYKKGRINEITIIDDDVFSLLFCVIIVNLANAQTSIINIKNRVILYLGKISYGIYMYHNMVIVFSIWFISKYLGVQKSGFWLYLSAIGLTIILSSISYEFFEKKFLRIKAKYAMVKSGKAIE